MGIKFTNNALTLLAAGLSAADTIVTVLAGTGAGFPAIVGGAGDYFILTMENAAGQREFIRVNHRGGDTMGTGAFPCVRGYYGTVPRVWAPGDSVDLRWSADVVQDYLTTISGRYLGAFAVAPVADQFGGAIKAGDLYYDTVLLNLLAYSGVAWGSAIQFVEQLHPDGSAAAPGMSWVTAPTMGIWKSGAASMDVAIGGARIVGFGAGGAQMGAGKVLRLDDGTAALPALSFANEIDMGIIRSAPKGFQVIVGGAPILGISDLTVTANKLFVANAGANSTFFYASGSIAAGAITPNCSALVSTGMTCVGGAPNAYGGINLRSRDSAGGALIAYSWTANANVAHGYHTFYGFPNGGFMRVYGGAYNTGAGGTSLQVFDANNTVVAGIDMVETDGTPGAVKANMRFSITRLNGFVAAGDMILGYTTPATGYLAQLTINSSWTAQPADSAHGGFRVFGNMAGISLYDFGGSAACWSELNNTMYFSFAVATGLISGYGSTMTHNGQWSAASYNVVSDRMHKEKIEPVRHALRDLLKLSGVRYFNKGLLRDDMGLVAQDVAPVFPELVSEASAPHLDGQPEPEKIKTLNYNGLHAATIEAIREIDARLKLLEAV